MNSLATYEFQSNRWWQQQAMHTPLTGNPEFPRHRSAKSVAQPQRCLLRATIGCKTNQVGSIVKIKIFGPSVKVRWRILNLPCHHCTARRGEHVGVRDLRCRSWFFQLRARWPETVSKSGIFSISAIRGVELNWLTSFFNLLSILCRWLPLSTSTNLESLQILLVELGRGVSLLSSWSFTWARANVNQYVSCPRPDPNSTKIEGA